MVDDGRRSGQNGKAQSQLRYPRGYPKPITLNLTVDEHQALRGGHNADRVPMAGRLRALITLCRQDPALAEAVSTRAEKLLLIASPGPIPSPAPQPPAASFHPQSPPAF